MRGDVEGIYNTSGTLQARYIYDSWGKTVSVLDANDNIITNTNHIGNINPIRYRGYYLDSESGFYYVSSRYYDPEIGRFISLEPNVDFGEFDEGTGLIGYNVYAYCANNPVMYKDETGESITLCILIGAGIGLVAGGAFGALVGWGAGALIAKYGVSTAVASITKGGGARFSSFNALKRFLGSPYRVFKSNMNTELRY